MTGTAFPSSDRPTRPSCQRTSPRAQRPRASRMLAAILAITFIVGADPAGVGPTAPVAAAGATYRYYMDVVSPRTTLCLGEKVHYRVVVNRETDDANTVPVGGVKVEAYADDPSIGTFSGKGKGGSVFVSTQLDFATPFSAEFTFTAGKKIGATTLEFQGLVSYVSPIGRGYVSFGVPVQVIPCKYKMSSIVRFPPNGTFNTGAVEPPIVAKMKSTLLTSDADGNFTGTGTIHWIGTSLTSGCTVSQKFGGDTSVALTGKIFDDHLQVTMIYQPGNGALTVECGGVKQGMPSDAVQLDQLDIELPMNGGSLKQTQAHSQGTYPGKVLVSAILVKG
jgi:hypothetical protein